MEQRTQLELARAVSRDDTARLIDEHNRATELVSMQGAVDSGYAYFVVPRPELLVVDLDLPQAPHQSAGRVASLDRLLDAAARAAVPTVALSSGRPGHQHAYLLTGTGIQQQLLARWCQDHGLDVRSRGIRPPGAPHRSGAANPMEADKAAQILAVLTSTVDPKATDRLAAELTPVHLTHRLNKALRYGAEEAGYPSASEARMALAVCIVAHGGSPAYLEALLRNPANALSASFIARSAREQRAELDRLWRKACDRVAKDPGAHAIHETLSSVLTAARSAAWPGQSGGSDLAVLEALISVAWNVPTTTPAVALLAIAQGAGLSKDTARRAIRRLEVSGWVRVVAPETASTARVYSLCARAPSTAASTAECPAAKASLADLGADHAHRTGLGKSTARVLRELRTQGTTTTKRLAGALAMTPATAAHHLRKLCLAGLADRDGRVVRAHDDAVVASITARWDSNGASARQAAAYAVIRKERAEQKAAAIARWHRDRTHGGSQGITGTVGLGIPPNVHS